MPFYTIIAGVNGVGKSSFSGIMKTERSDLGYVVDVDKLRQEDNSAPIAAGKTAIEKINVFLSKGISFAQETTLSGHRTERTAKSAKEKGYIVRMYYIGLSTADESIKRIQNRVDKGGHHIAPADVERRHNKRFRDLMKILPYCDEARFFDNENGFIEVAEYRNGEIIPKGGYRPPWLIELLDAYR